MLRAASTEEGFDLAADMVDFHGQGHSAVIHTGDPALAERYGRRMKTVRIIVNSPSSQGAIGGIYNRLVPSLTLGCGSWGSTSVSDNVSAAQLLNIKRVTTRQNNMQWFKVPPKIYFEPQAIRYLAAMPDVQRVTVVTDATMTRLGYVERVSRVLQQRQQPVTIQVIDDVEPEPSIDSVQRGAALMRDFRPDTIIALGGGSPMDAAKVMWLLYEQPDVDFADMRQKFSDIRKRAFRFPVLGKRARLVCVPTTSGTGAEVTPFAVISDPATGKKYPLADYALTPSVAIIDPVLTNDLSASLAADSGFDALTHATERTSPSMPTTSPTVWRCTPSGWSSTTSRRRSPARRHNVAWHGRRCTTRAPSPAWPSAMPSSASSTRCPTPWAPPSTSPTGGPMRSSCRT